MRVWSWGQGPVHLLPAPPENARAGGVAEPRGAGQCRARSPGRFTSAQDLLSDSPPRSAGLFSRRPSRRVTAPSARHPAPARPGRDPLAALSPSIPAGRRIWAGRPVGRKEDGREALPSPRARPASPRPAPHLPTLRAQPGLRFPSGEREKVLAPPPPLKGAALPLPHLLQPGSALSPKHLSGAPKGLDFPSPPLASPEKLRLPSRRDRTGGVGGGICPGAVLRLFQLLEQQLQAQPLLPARSESPGVGASGNRQPRAGGWNALLASAALVSPAESQRSPPPSQAQLNLETGRDAIPHSFL